MTLLADISKSRACGENQGLFKVRLPIRSLQIDSDEVERFPDALCENLHVQIFLSGHWDKVASDLFRHFVEILPVHKIYFVENYEGRNIFSVTRKHVDQLIIVDVFSDQNAPITYSIGFHYSFDRCLGELGEFSASSHGQPSLGSTGDCHIRRLLVNPNTHTMELIPQQLYLAGLENV